MPAHERRHQVRRPEDVEPAAEDGARYAVEGRSVPGDFWAVDGEVRGYRPVAALGDEDFLRVGGFEILGCGGSAGDEGHVSGESDWGSLGLGCWCRRIWRAGLTDERWRGVRRGGLFDIVLTKITDGGNEVHE